MASMFIVGNDGNIWGYVMTGTLIALGLFFILVGCACISGYDDLKKGDVSEKNPEAVDSALLDRTDKA